MNTELEEEINRLIAALSGLATRLGIPSGVINDFVGDLRLMAQSVSGARTATEAFQRMIQTNIGQYAQLIFSLNTVNSSVYGATEAFRSIIPTVDAVKAGFDSLVKFSTNTARIFGERIGGVLAKPLQLFSAGLDFATNALRFQIDAAQKVADAFIEASKTGALFAGSIQQFYLNAVSLRLPIQTFSKIVVTNAENIAKLGLGMQEGGYQIADSTSRIVHSNRVLDNNLVALYGSVESLSEGVSDYLALQAQSGVNVQDALVLERNRNGATAEYLLRQKELTALTGKSAKVLKDEEEKRRRELDYSLKLSRLTSKDAQNNVSEGIALATKIFGEEAGQVAKEFFATEGNLVSRDALQFAGSNAEAMQAIARIMGAVNQDTAAFRTNYTDLIEQNRRSWLATAKAGEDLFTINRAASNALLTSMGNVNASLLSNTTLLENVRQLTAELDRDRKRLSQAPIDDDLYKETRAYVASLRNNLQTQMALDVQVTKNMGQMGEITQAFGMLTRSMVAFQAQMFGIVSQAMRGINEAGGNALQSLGPVFDNLIRQMGDWLAGNTPAGTPPQGGTPDPGQPPRGVPGTPAGVPPSNPPDPGRPGLGGDRPNEGAARGGVVNSPTIVGEAGPERLAGDLVFPYDRPVPIAVDWTPLIAEVQNLQNTMAELVEINDRILDTNNDVLNAVS